jgi:ABC-type proline/glycine betaine transport system ATPase subunit
MEEKMDDIIRFAELGDYIYQPVRMYSSGMNSRLAFSMAVHIDPEILISDEILSVGDVRFQQKCHRRIREMMEMGKTILLCTHNMGAVREYCHRALWLHEGKMMALGNAREVTDEYEQFMLLNTGKNSVLKRNNVLVETNCLADKLPDNLKDRQWVWFDSLNENETYISMGRIHDGENTITKLSGGQTVWLSFGIQSPLDKMNVSLVLTINGKFSIPVLILSNAEFSTVLNLEKKTVQVISIKYVMPYLSNGKYTISAELTEKVEDNVVLLDKIHDGLSFMVEDKDARGNHKSQLRLSGANFETESFPL